MLHELAASAPSADTARQTAWPRHIDVPLPPGSLLIMTGASQLLWTHALLPLVPAPAASLAQPLRVSLTFRTLLPHVQGRCGQAVRDALYRELTTVPLVGGFFGQVQEQQQIA
jgi:hypothetical protein